VPAPAAKADACSTGSSSVSPLPLVLPFHILALPCRPKLCPAPRMGGTRKQSGRSYLVECIHGFQSAAPPGNFTTTMPQQNVEGLACCDANRFRSPANLLHAASGVHPALTRLHQYHGSWDRRLCNHPRFCCFFSEGCPECLSHRSGKQQEDQSGRLTAPSGVLQGQQSRPSCRKLAAMAAACPGAFHNCNLAWRSRPTGQAKGLASLVRVHHPPHTFRPLHGAASAQRTAAVASRGLCSVAQAAATQHAQQRTARVSQWRRMPRAADGRAQRDTTSREHTVAVTPSAVADLAKHTGKGTADG
jgi:hypothetical protein